MTFFCASLSLASVALVDQDAHLGAVEAGIDAELGLLVPAQIEDAGDRPAVAVDHAALERGVDLARRGLHHGGAERLEEVAIDRGDAQLEPGQVGPGDRLRQIEVEGIVVDVPRQQDRIHLLVVDVGHVGVAAVLAQLRHRPLGELPGIRFRHHVGVEGAGHVGDVDHAVLERIADLERRHRLRPADVVDLDHALAVGVDLLDEPLEAARVERLLGKRRDALERHLLSAGDAGRSRQHKPCRCSGQPVAHDVLPIPCSRPYRALGTGKEHDAAPVRNTPGEIDFFDRIERNTAPTAGIGTSCHRADGSFCITPAVESFCTSHSEAHLLPIDPAIHLRI